MLIFFILHHKKVLLNSLHMCSVAANLLKNTLASANVCGGVVHTLTKLCKSQLSSVTIFNNYTKLILQKNVFII